MDGLISYLKRTGSLRTESVEQALRTSPRENFISEDLKRYAQMDRSVPIGLGQTSSKPTTIIQMLEALDVGKTNNVLEIGTGSGWQTALLARLSNHVYTVERFDELSNKARKNLNGVLINNVSFRIGDGSYGWEGDVLYDRIIVNAAAPRVIEALLTQLKVGGKMVIPIGRWTQEVFVVEKTLHGIIKRGIGFFSFVPLIGANGFSA
jgi:protein-L-isoaspartate(D-aspartate) O-methyltransferase